MVEIGRISYPDDVFFQFTFCFVEDHGIESAVTTLINQAKTYHQSTMTANMFLSLDGNNLTHKGVGTILSVCDMASCLDLSGNLHSPSSSVFIALKLLTEALSSNTASKPHFLCINDWQLTSRHAYHLLLLITQARNLQKLTIGLNELQESVPLLVSAAKNLTVLDITASEIEDKELLEVCLIVQSNTDMRELHVTSSATYTDAMDTIRIETVSRFIEIIISPDSQSCLERLVIADCYLEILKRDKIQSALKLFTFCRGFPIEITSATWSKETNHAVRMKTAAASIPSSLLHGKT